MNRRWISPAATILVLLSGGALMACGSSDESGHSATPSSRKPVLTASQKQDRGFLSLLSQQDVLSMKPDGDLVQIGRSVCDQPLDFPDMVAAWVRSQDRSLDQGESATVVQAAVKTFCPESAQD